MPSKKIELAQECKRQTESCLYTSTTFFIWIRILTRIKYGFLVTSLVLGSLAGWNLLSGSERPELKIMTAVCAFIAGLLPTISTALKLDERLEIYKQLAGEFKNLQDGFRQAALVSSQKGFDNFEADVKVLMNRLEKARGYSLTPPDWVFRKGQKKVKSGDYDFDLDVRAIEGTNLLTNRNEQ